jgi:hypothetical protein
MPGIDEFTPHYFEEASKAWMANKIRVGAMMMYRCSYAMSSKRQCPKAAEPGCDFCANHAAVEKPKVYPKNQLFL